MDYQKRVSLNKARLRKISWRENLKAAVKAKDSEAIYKMKQIRESETRRAADQRESTKADQKSVKVKDKKRRKSKHVGKSGRGKT